MVAAFFYGGSVLFFFVYLRQQAGYDISVLDQKN
jgi:hypothetical protein